MSWRWPASVLLALAIACGAISLAVEWMMPRWASTWEIMTVIFTLAFVMLLAAERHRHRIRR